MQLTSLPAVSIVFAAKLFHLQLIDRHKQEDEDANSRGELFPAYEIKLRPGLVVLGDLTLIKLILQEELPGATSLMQHQLCNMRGDPCCTTTQKNFG